MKYSVTLLGLLCLNVFLFEGCLNTLPSEPSSTTKDDNTTIISQDEDCNASTKNCTFNLKSLEFYNGSAGFNSIIDLSSYLKNNSFAMIAVQHLDQSEIQYFNQSLNENKITFIFKENQNQYSYINEDGHFVIPQNIHAVYSSSTMGLREDTLHVENFYLRSPSIKISLQNIYHRYALESVKGNLKLKHKPCDKDKDKDKITYKDIDVMKVMCNANDTNITFDLESLLTYHNDNKDYKHLALTTLLGLKQITYPEMICKIQNTYPKTFQIEKEGYFKFVIEKTKITGSQTTKENLTVFIGDYKGTSPDKNTYIYKNHATEALESLVNFDPYLSTYRLNKI